MRFKGFKTVTKQHTDSTFDLVRKLYWIIIVTFRFLTKLAINFHTNPSTLPLT